MKYFVPANLPNIDRCSMFKIFKDIIYSFQHISGCRGKWFLKTRPVLHIIRLHLPNKKKICFFLIALSLLINVLLKYIVAIYIYCE